MDSAEIRALNGGQEWPCGEGVGVRRGVEDDGDGPVEEWSWIDPQAWETNAAGGVTPAQRELITGPWVGPPVLLWVLVVALVVIEGGAGWYGATTNGGFVPEGGWLGAVSAMAFIMVVVGWQLVAGVLAWGLPAWGDRYDYRKAIADLAACRVGSAVGRIETGPSGPQAQVRRAEADSGGSEARAEAEPGLGGPEAWVGQVGADPQEPQVRVGQVGAAPQEPQVPVGQGEVGLRPPQDLGEAEVIPVPFAAPALPPPGAYRLYWLERGKRGRLLLSAQPLDE
jgi:hypothetical protein